MTLPALQPTAKFVTELFGPLPGDFVGSMTFDTGEGEGLAPLTIRQGTNRFFEPLFATLPVVELDAPAEETRNAQGGGVSIIFPHLGAGLGLTTQILLINPSSQTIRGRIELTASDGSALDLELEGESGSSFDYELAPDGVFRGTITADSGVQSGYAVVTSDGVAPSGTAVFQFRSGDESLISEAGVGVASSTRLARIFVDTFQTQTGVAVAIPGGMSGMRTFALSDLSGNPVGEVGRDLPADGHLAVFVDELFEDLPSSFKGVLEITGRTQVDTVFRPIDFSAVTLKLTINGRGDPILTTLPVATATPSGRRLIFPQVGFGSGLSTRFVLINAQGGSELVGNLSFTQSDGSELMTILGGETGSAFDWFVTARGAVQLRPGDAAEPVQIVSPPAEVVVNRGSNLEFRPLVFDENGDLRDDFRLDYLSLDDQVAQVDSGGMILGGEAGFSTLTIQVGDLVETTTVTVVGVTEGVSGFTLRGISEDPAGGLFLSSPGTHTILRARNIQDRPTIYAGVPSQLGFRDDAKLTALFNNPGSVALNRANGSLYVADRNNHVIRRIPLEDAGQVETIAGDGQAGSGDGIGASARFNSPTGVALDVSGGLWVADSGNHTIRRIDLLTGMVETIAGLAGQPGSADGVGAAARFNSPSGIAVRREPLALQLQREQRGEPPPLTIVIVADSGNDDLRLVSSDGRTDRVIVRRREPLQSGGVNSGSFDEPRGVAGDSSGNMFVSEGSGQVMTVLPDGTVVPAAQEGTFEKPGDLTITESGRIIVTDAEVTGRELGYGAPDIMLIEPDQVGMTGGQQITLRGRNYAPDSIVVLDGSIMEGAQIVDTSTIRFTLPPLTSGLKTVTVQNRGGIDQIALDVPPPALRDLEPGGITTVVGGGDFTGDGLIATEANLGTPFHHGHRQPRESACRRQSKPPSPADRSRDRDYYLSGWDGRKRSGSKRNPRADLSPEQSGGHKI